MLTTLFPWSIDLLVYSGLAAAALSGFWLPALKGFKLPWPAANAPALPAGPPATPESQWMQESVDTLIRLQATLEARQMTQAAKLCRQLTWEVLGGDKA